MRYEQIVRAKGGTHRRIQNVDEIVIPDMWHTAEAIRASSAGEPTRPLTQEDAKLVVETWSLCHDLLEHIKRVCVEPRTT